MLRFFGMAAVTALTALQSSCAPPGQARVPNFASLDRPLSDSYVQLALIERKRVEVNASGRTVRVAAPEGYCFPTAGVMTGADSAFLLMQTCNGDPGKDVLSISIAKHGLFGDAPPSEESFAAFRSFLETRDGASQLGLDAGSGAVFLIDTKYENGALYAMTQDASGATPSFSGQVICRAFTELNGRMVVVSAIASKQSKRDPEVMRADLARVVNRLIAENGGAGV